MSRDDEPVPPAGDPVAPAGDDHVDGSDPRPAETGKETEPEGEPEVQADGEDTASEAPKGFRAKWTRRLARLIPRTPRGLLGLVGGLMLLGVFGTLGGVHVVEYSESASFCTTCHTMTPQKKAYEVGIHQNVACGSCHVDPGMVGFVKAKLAGTRELYALVTNTYPTPIPPLPHEELPPTEHTCQECHSLSQIALPGQPSKLISRASFSTDEKNTRNDLAVLIRPANADGPDAVSLHWHVLQEVTYTTAEEDSQTIDSVRFKDEKTGVEEQYIAEREIRESINAGADLARLTATQKTRTMDCLSCHNRVGHDVPDANKEVDAALAAGTIDPSLPYVKRNAMALLTKKYATDEQGRDAISHLGDYYTANYPLVAKKQASDIAAASRGIESIFDVTTTSHMNTRSGTYPDNLGHQTTQGCFRCHDGAHYKVVAGRATKETIPSTCDTCHTAPQGSTTVANVPLGARPADHDDPLWVFDHRVVAGSTSADPATCGACHKTSYCENCHKTGAIKVSHDQMLYNHAASVTAAGSSQACAVCHQPAYCTQCHKDNVLPRSNSRLSAGGG